MKQLSRNSRLLKHPAITLWLLFSFVAQSFIPLQSHTHFVTNEQGQSILICSLNGSYELTIESHTSTSPSAAWAFSEILSDTTSYSYTTDFYPIFTTASNALVVKVSDVDIRHWGDLPIRAPPVSEKTA